MLVMVVIFGFVMVCVFWVNNVFRVCRMGLFLLAIV